ncbi:MAG: EAL domain-containing protein [Rhodocyclaceae bacterium]|nr:EAL domain-containing protein [Rhodocyclaceae bacterium]
MMNKRGPTRRTGAHDRRSGANESTDNTASRTAAPGETVAEREAAVLVDEQVVLDREHVVLGREEDVLGREEIALADEGVVHRREEAVNGREQASDLREESAELREDVATLREQAMRTQEAVARETALRSARAEAQLRDANEHLIVAAVNAQTMTEAAALTSTQMAHMAEHDFLTGLPNRSLLIDRLAQAIVLAQHHDKKVALICLDLDHFKHINDSLGRAGGDRLLQSAARRLQSCIRHCDTVSRQGGDEFVVLLAEVETAQDAALAAEKLMKAMAEPHLIDGHRLHVTLSVGISVYPEDGKDAETMLQNAEIAMYHAKRKGRNSYQVFTPDMNLRAVARQSIAEALHHALDQHEFVVHYQPKVDLETGRLTGAEALVRWRQPTRLIGPAQFIGIAEDCGLILPLGRWVLREACQQTQAWLQAGGDFGVIAVNVSSVEFHGKDFLSGVRTVLDDTGLDPHHLEIELTESGLMQDTESTMALLYALKDLGITIAVDDFGTGYSSLSYLRRFPIDTLKIDQSFVQDIDGETGKAIVSAIIAMGTSLKQRVVAEGIETRQQLAFLQSHHCHEGQGNIFSQPVAADEFATRLFLPRGVGDFGEVIGRPGGA